jgi:hypothetical protein
MRRVILLTLFVAAGCGSANASTSRSVIAVGDSITLYSAPAIRSAVPHSMVIAAFGLTALQISNLADEAVLARPDVLIVNAGTNDALLHYDWHVGFSALARDVQKVRCGFFVTLNEQRLGASARAWNADLRVHHFRTIDWNAAVAGNRTLVDQSGYHASTVGAQWLATAYERAVQTCGS